MSVSRSFDAATMFEARHLPLVEKLFKSQLAARAGAREATQRRLLVRHVRGGAHAMQQLRLDAGIAQAGQIEERLQSKRALVTEQHAIIIATSSRVVLC